jgi:delta 1-pyrroline-5-carboxylate dehydrogenase
MTDMTTPGSPIPDVLTPDPLSANGADLDRTTAWLRRAEADGAAFLSRFAHLIREALPRMVTVETRTTGLFRKTTEITGVRVAFETECFVMKANRSGGLDTSIEKQVRGVVIATRPTPPHAWFAQLMDTLKSRTSHAGAMADLLKSL